MTRAARAAFDGAEYADVDADTFFPITNRVAERVEAWESGPVTLLGDAIHTMPPTGGVGCETPAHCDLGTE